MKPKILTHLPGMIRSLEKQTQAWEEPVVGKFVGGEHAAFKILISTVLSLRTKDTTTWPASLRLFKLADTPEKMLKLSIPKIEEAIYPVGFYHTKAKNIIKICQILVDQYGSAVPDDLDKLLELPGVGRKTANLVVTIGYNKPGICVDTHVHRISNRWGLVKTKWPDETEMVLRKVLPTKYWMIYNDLLVSFGQNLCVPISPFCSRCQFKSICPKIGVTSSR